MSTDIVAKPNSAADQPDFELIPEDPSRTSSASQPSGDTHAIASDENNMMEDSFNSDPNHSRNASDQDSSSAASNADEPVYIEEPTSLPPPPRRKSGVLINSPAIETPPPVALPGRLFIKRHSRTNTFGHPLPEDDRRTFMNGVSKHISSDSIGSITAHSTDREE